MSNRTETTPIPAKCAGTDDLHTGYLFYDIKLNMILCSRHKALFEADQEETRSFEWVLLS